MTIEQEFFEAFCLSPVICISNFYESFIGSMDELIKSMPTCDESWIRENYEQINREITPEIVLKLAATLNDIVFSKIECCCLFTGETVEEITNNILSDCIDHKDEIQDQIKALFNA